MRKTKPYDDRNGHCISSELINGMLRKAIINKLVVDFYSEGYAEEEVWGLFLWKLADLDPPVSKEEQLYFHALYRIHRNFCDFTIDKKETALEILGIPKDRLDLSQKELVKETKIVYWKQFNELSPNLNSLLTNSLEIGIKKKAFIYLCG